MTHPTRALRVASWNVNGLRACAKKGFLEWLSRSRAQVVGRSAGAGGAGRPGRRPPPAAPLAHPLRPGRTPGLQRRRALQPPGRRGEFDAEGRFQLARFGSLAVANVCFPNGNGRNRDLSRIPFKLDFYRHLFDRLDVQGADHCPVGVDVDPAVTSTHP